MITAKDDFMFDRELMQDLVVLAKEAGLSNEEMASMFEGVENVKQYVELQKTLLDLQISPLEKVRRGQTLSQRVINKAVTEAAKRGE